MSSPKKIIAVVDATGNQGSSVARTFHALPSWHVRALTRTPSSPAAQALASSGIELVRADLRDPASLAAAFAGVHAVSLNTNFWALFRHLAASSSATTTDLDAAARHAFGIEVLHGKNAARAAAGVDSLERFVYTALGPMGRASGGRYARTFHWEAKASIVDFVFTEKPGLAAKTSLVYPGAHNTNPLLFPRPDPQTGEYVLATALRPGFRMPIVDPARSTGPFVRALVEDEAPGTKVLACDTDSWLTVEEALEVWARATRKTARLERVSVRELHERSGAPIEVLETLEYLNKFGYMAGVEGLVEPRGLKRPPMMTSWEEWLRARGREGDA